MIPTRLLTACLLPPVLAAEPALDPRLEAALDELDSRFDSAFAWWGEVYDPESGGCFYSLSAKALHEAGSKRHAPDIEATSKLVNVLEWSDLLDDAPPAFKRGVIRYMQSRQDPDSGFFRDPEFADTYTPKTLDRAVGMASGSIRRCGGEPLHPLPIERVADNHEAAAHYAHLHSPATFIAWLDELPWRHRVWTCGSSIRTQSGVLLGMEEPRRTQLLEALEGFLAAKQAADGYYGRPEDDHWWSRLSGTYKAISTLGLNQRPIPMRDTLVATTLDHLREREWEHLIVLYNTCNMVTILHRHGADYPVELKVEIIERASAAFARLKHEDGGFVTHLVQPRPSANGKMLGKKGLIESNTNATGLAHKSRALLHELATGGEWPFPHPEGEVLVEALSSQLQDEATR